MDLQLNYTQLHRTGGDETAPYKVTTNRVCSLRELIDKIKSGTEHGHITINDGNNRHYLSDYHKNSIDGLPQNALDKVVRKIDSAGGWGRMDYRIWV